LLGSNASGCVPQRLLSDFIGNGKSWDSEGDGEIKMRGSNKKRKRKKGIS
jgi:hypothetical protein